MATTWMCCRWVEGRNFLQTFCRMGKHKCQQCPEQDIGSSVDGHMFMLVVGRSMQQVSEVRTPFLPIV
jgi:hypothetical protein